MLQQHCPGRLEMLDFAYCRNSFGSKLYFLSLLKSLFCECFQRGCVAATAKRRENPISNSICSFLSLSRTLSFSISPPEHRTLYHPASQAEQVTIFNRQFVRSSQIYILLPHNLDPCLAVKVIIAALQLIAIIT